MLLLLDRRTWPDDALERDVLQAIGKQQKIVLVHELPSWDGSRHAVAFDGIMACTPPTLRRLYDNLAVPLKGGPLRQVSLEMLRAKLLEESGELVWGRPIQTLKRWLSERRRMELLAERPAEY